MGYGALKSAEAVAKALSARELTPTRVSKAFRHLANREEYRAVVALLQEDDAALLQREKERRGLDW